MMNITPPNSGNSCLLVNGYLEGSNRRQTMTQTVLILGANGRFGVEIGQVFQFVFEFVGCAVPHYMFDACANAMDQQGVLLHGGQ